MGEFELRQRVNISVADRHQLGTVIARTVEANPRIDVMLDDGILINSIRPNDQTIYKVSVIDRSDCP